MERLNSSTNLDQCDVVLSELDGYVELGMAKEAVALAGATLRRRHLTPEQFEEAVIALLIHANKPRRWKRCIDRAFEGMTARHKRRVSTTMLHFYTSFEDLTKAGAVHLLEFAKKMKRASTPL